MQLGCTLLWAGCRHPLQAACRPCRRQHQHHHSACTLAPAGRPLHKHTGSHQAQAHGLTNCGSDMRPTPAVLQDHHSLRGVSVSFTSIGDGLAAKCCAFESRQPPKPQPEASTGCLTSCLIGAKIHSSSSTNALQVRVLTIRFRPQYASFDAVSGLSSASKAMHNSRKRLICFGAHAAMPDRRIPAFDASESTVWKLAAMHSRMDPDSSVC